MFIWDLDAVNMTNDSKWRTQVTILVKDASQQPVANAKVYGAWSYGSNANCISDAYGQCKILSNEFEGTTMDAIRFTVNNIVHDESLRWVYDPVLNSDPDNESDGTMIEALRPVPTLMFVSDLDGMKSTNGSKWRITVVITVRDANQQSVAGAKVYGVWTYGKNVDCTTDANGQCSLTSNEFDVASVTSIGLSVTSIIHSESLVWNYDQTLNTDPDGESSGTVITLDRP
jgi:hypothetical protein